jgi:PRTRC genetic system protein B
MNERTEALLRSYKPELAIVVYKGGVTNNDDYYLESHVVNDKGQLLEGRPLMQDTLNGIVDVFFDDRANRAQVGGIIPESLLKFEVLPGGNHELIWYRLEEKRQLFFSPGLHIPSGTAWVPALIYHAKKSSLSVYAITDTSRPVDSTKLYKAPFHNVNSEGDVCLGSAKVKRPDTKTYDSIMKYWEDMFWLSEFSHLAQNGNPTKSNLTLLWKQLIGKETKWSDFKTSELVLIKGQTLTDIL